MGSKTKYFVSKKRKRRNVERLEKARAMRWQKKNNPEEQGNSSVSVETQSQPTDIVTNAEQKVLKEAQKGNSSVSVEIETHSRPTDIVTNAEQKVLRKRAQKSSHLPDQNGEQKVLRKRAQKSSHLPDQNGGTGGASSLVETSGVCEVEVALESEGSNQVLLENIKTEPEEENEQFVLEIDDLVVKIEAPASPDPLLLEIPQKRPLELESESNNAKRLKVAPQTSQNLPIVTDEANNYQFHITLNREAACQTSRVGVYDKNIQTAKSISVDRKLVLDLARYKRRIKKLENKKPPKPQDTFDYLCDEFLTDNLSEFIKIQTALRSTNKYNLAYKMFCLNLLYKNPQRYRLLEKTICVPSMTALVKMYSPISTQIHEDLMTALEKRVENMSAREKNCTLVVTAIKLKANLSYNVKNDKVVGFHEVDGVQSPLPARYALVALVRGFLFNWYQPVGYALLADRIDENTSKWIDKIMGKLFEIGLNIRAIVSDFGPDTLDVANNKDVSAERTHFTFDGHKIYYIFNAPDLIKSVRDNFLTHDFHFENGVARFQHVVKFFEFEQSRPLKLAYKLTNSHLKPNNAEKTKLSYAAQLLSRSVASGLSNCIENKVIGESGRATVEFVKNMNDLFDALNSIALHHSYKPKCAFRGDDDQVEFFNKMMHFFKTLKLVNSKTETTENADFIQGFLITIRSVLDLFEDLKREGYKHLMTKRLNCDVIEHIHDEIKTACNGKKPSSRQFDKAFRRNFFANIVLKKEGKTMELPDILTHLNDSEQNDDQEQNMAPREKDPMDITCSDYRDVQIPEKDGIYSFSGYLLEKCAVKHKKCYTFKMYKDVNQPSGSPGARFQRCITFAKDKTLPSFFTPDDFLECVERMDLIFQKTLKNRIEGKIGQTILEQLDKTEILFPCPCFPMEYLQKLFIRMRIHHVLITNNKAFKSPGKKVFSVPKL